jgi:hypothetical protein
MEKDWLTQRTAARVDPGNHKFLIVETNIAIAEFAIDGDLLLVFTEDSISNLRQRIQYLV